MENVCFICEKRYTKTRKNGDRGELCSSCAVTKQRRLVKSKAIAYKGGCCQMCGYNKCEASLTFHHIDPKQKEFGLSEKGIKRKWEIMQKELDKCILLCHNCHYELHDSESTRKKMNEYIQKSNENKGIIPHGKRVAYTYHKCRCDECKKSNNEYTKKLNIKKALKNTI